MRNLKSVGINLASTEEMGKNDIQILEFIVNVNEKRKRNDKQTNRRERTQRHHHKKKKRR